MKWIGQHIWDFISRFRSDVYLEDIADAGSDTDKFLVAESDGKIAYRTGAEVLSDIGASSESTDLEFSGDTANGVLTYGGAAQIDVESTLTYDGLTLNHQTAPSGTYVTNIHTDTPGVGWASGTNSGFNTVLTIDNNQNTASGQTNTCVGLAVSIDDDATHVGTIEYVGVSNTIDFANTNGTQKTKGVGTTITDGDTADMYGLWQKIEDGGNDLRFVSSANEADYFNIATGAEGATTISTVDADTAVAHLTLDADGHIILDSADCGATDGIQFKNNGAKFVDFTAHHSRSILTIYENAGATQDDYFLIDVDVAGATTITTLDSAGADANLSFNVDGQMIMQCTDETYSFGKNDNATTTIERLAHTDGNGGALKILAGYATSGQTNKNGGDIHLLAGASTGSGTPGSVNFEAALVGSTGTSLNSPNLLSKIMADPLLKTSQFWFADNGAVTNDWFAIFVAADGATTLSTNDQAGTDASLQITADGTAELAGTTVTLDSAGAITFERGSNSVEVPDDAGTIQLQGKKTGQYIQVPIKDVGSYMFYLYNDDSWYSAGSTTLALLGSSTAPGNLSSGNSEYQGRISAYVAPAACILQTLTFTFYWSSTAISGDADIDFGFSKHTSIADGTAATVTMNAIAATDHDGTYTEAKPYAKVFTFSGGNATFAAGDCFSFHMRTTGGSSAQRVLVYGVATLDLVLT